MLAAGPSQGWGSLIWEATRMAVGRQRRSQAAKKMASDEQLITRWAPAC
jgi:hypothetical protein